MLDILTANMNILLMKVILFIKNKPVDYIEALITVKVLKIGRNNVSQPTELLNFLFALVKQS